MSKIVFSEIFFLIFFVTFSKLFNENSILKLSKTYTTHLFNVIKNPSKAKTKVIEACFDGLSYFSNEF